MSKSNKTKASRLTIAQKPDARYPRWRSRGVLGAGICIAGLIALFAYLNPDLVPGLLGGEGRPPHVKTPNVLLISIDMLRADHVHAYGNPHKTTPNLDQLATEGVLFENQISATSWTLPAHASMFTSLPPTVHGCIFDDRPLSPAIPTLAQKFKDAGYATAGFYSGPYLNEAFGLAHGFDHYENCTSYRAQTEVENGKPHVILDPEIDEESHRDVTSPTVLAAVRNWMKQRDERPFFMFVHWWDAHYDFIPPPPYDKMFDPDYTGTLTGQDFYHEERINPRMSRRDFQHVMALYDGEIAWTDWHIGQLLDDLRTAKLLDQTIVVVTSDHGTEFFEHGVKGHRYSLYDESLHVPLIMRFPSELPRGVRRNPQTRVVDVAPTILDLAGLPPFEMTRGRSLVPLARTGVAPSDGNLAFCDIYTPMRRLRALRTSDWKIIQDLRQHTIEFYDLRRDPGETSSQQDNGNPAVGNAVALFSQTLGSLRQMAAHVEQLKVAAASGGPANAGGKVPATVTRQLKSLGYLDNDGEGSERPSSQPQTLPGESTDHH